ncbi:MAG: trigger factor [Xanthomonadaceae bacterium]|nr:trigger factor [Xanthomonadaceae bacterium]
MQVSMEKTGDLGRRLTVELPAAEIDGQVDGRLNELRRQVRLKGFRPGKVPMNVVRQRYGSQVRQEVTQQVMQTSLQQAIGEQNLRVAGVSSLQPRADEDADGFCFVAEVEVFPELPDIDVSNLEIDRPVVEIGDSDVDDMIQTLREQRRKWSAVDRGARLDDRVKVQYSAEIDDRRVPETGMITAQPILGSGALFESFEQVLTGLETGAEQTEELTFPDDFHEDRLGGKTARVTFRVVAVESSDLPEATDEFATEFGIEGGIEQMRIDVRRNLERELRSTRSNRLKRAVTDGLAERYSDFSLPESAVQQELAQMKAQVRQQYGEDVDLPDQQMRPAAERRIRLGVLLAEIARQHQLEIDPERVRGQIADIADTYENPAEVIELYQQNPQLTGQIENSVLEEQVVDWVLENATVNDREMTFKQLMETA